MVPLPASGAVPCAHKRKWTYHKRKPQPCLAVKTACVKSGPSALKESTQLLTFRLEGAKLAGFDELQLPPFESQPRQFWPEQPGSPSWKNAATTRGEVVEVAAAVGLFSVARHPSANKCDGSPSGRTHWPC